MPRPLRIIRFWILWPGLFVYFLGSHRTRVLIFNENNEALLVKGNTQYFFDNSKWGLPGGGLKRHELPAQGAIREVAEELSVTLNIDSLCALGSQKVRSYGLAYLGHFFVATVSKDMSFVVDGHEISVASWVALSDILPSQAKPELLQALQLLRQS